ncbi:RNA polymerase sigma factor [Kordia aestuariivivens]|nr:sigma-70 family RNA polymerase sigma factor [Kordia aestuariivivens]
MTDEHIMQKVAEGNVAMLQILFERYHKQIYIFLYKMSGDKMLSEDLTQEVFYRLIKYKSSYNFDKKFVTWIYTIARNNLNTHYQRQKENHLALEGFEHKLVEPQASKNEEYSHLMNVLNRMEASDRELLILNRFQEIKYAEMAEILGSTTGAVKTKVCRALKKLKTLYLQKV